MHFGFALPGRGPLARPDVLVKLAEKADALRYSSIFVTDHVVIPTAYDSKYPYSSSGKAASDWDQGYLEPLALMSFLAGVTSRVRLGTSVLVVPYRNPVVTATTRPFDSSSAHCEYVGNSVTSALGALARRFFSDVEPATGPRDPCLRHARRPSVPRRVRGRASS